MTRDMWHVTCDTWWAGEHSLKISAPKLFRFGIESSLKIFWEKDDLINQLMTEVIVEQPRLHRVC